ncbi:MAG: hypothetical protein QUV06_08350 [Cyanobium sp. CZS 48M]|nr:hypothetical protein [Cyanobium sp. CZS48M]
MADPDTNILVMAAYPRIEFALANLERLANQVAHGAVQSEGLRRSWVRGGQRAMPPSWPSFGPMTAWQPSRRWRTHRRSLWCLIEGCSLQAPEGAPTCWWI